MQLPTTVLVCIYELTQVPLGSFTTNMRMAHFPLHSALLHFARGVVGEVAVTLLFVSLWGVPRE